MNIISYSSSLLASAALQAPFISAGKSEAGSFVALPSTAGSSVNNVVLQQAPVTMNQWCHYLVAQRGKSHAAFIYNSKGHVDQVLRASSSDKLDKMTVDATLDQTVRHIVREGLSEELQAPYVEKVILTPNELTYRRRLEGMAGGISTDLGLKLLFRWNQPAIRITWHEACAYAFWQGGRLPSLAEWQCAARAGHHDTEIYGTHSGTREGLGSEAHWQGNYDTTNRGTLAVRNLEPNPGGFYDLSGNVYEWLADPGERPTSKKIIGGSWMSKSAEALRGDRTTTVRAADAFIFLGLRIAKEIQV